MHKIFRYPNFSETLKGCPRKFSALWDQNFSTEKRDRPLFIHKTFWNQNFSRKVGFLYQSFRHCETLKFRLKNVMSPLSSINFFRYKKISGKQKGSFTKLFVSVLWDKKILTKPWCPSPSYAWNFSIIEFFWNTKMFSNEIFGYTETENRDTTPLIHKIFFPTRNFLKHRMVPWRGFFGPVR